MVQLTHTSPNPKSMMVVFSNTFISFPAMLCPIRLFYFSDIAVSPWRELKVYGQTPSLPITCSMLEMRDFRTASDTLLGFSSTSGSAFISIVEAWTLFVQFLNLKYRFTLCLHCWKIGKYCLFGN